VQANAFVDQAAEQATAIVDQMTPHVEAARDRLVTDYVPQAKKAGRRARKQVVEAAQNAAQAAAQNAPAPLARKKPSKRRGRTVLKLVALAGIGTAIGQWLRNRDVAPVSMYQAPSPTTVPPQPNASLDADPVPPGAVGEHDPDPEDLARLEEEAPPVPPEDSLTNTFFEEVLNETAKGSRRR